MVAGRISEERAEAKMRETHPEIVVPLPSASYARREIERDLLVGGISGSEKLDLGCLKKGNNAGTLTRDESEQEKMTATDHRGVDHPLVVHSEICG
jgi:hypothetical protein